MFNLAFVLGLLFLFTSRAREKSEMACEAVLLSLSAIRGSRIRRVYLGPRVDSKWESAFLGPSLWAFSFFAETPPLMGVCVCGILFTTGDSKSLGLFMTWNNKIGEVATTILSVCCLYVSL